VESSTLTRGTRSSVMGQDHLWLLTPDIGSVATNVPRRPIFLRDKDSGLRRMQWTKANRGQNGGQTQS
jgi:hypothetical protein